MNILSPSPWAAQQRDSTEIYRRLHKDRWPREPAPQRSEPSFWFAVAGVAFAISFAVSFIVTFLWR